MLPITPYSPYLLWVWRDLNSQPYVYKTSALTNCATDPYKKNSRTSTEFHGLFTESVSRSLPAPWSPSHLVIMTIAIYRSLGIIRIPRLFSHVWCFNPALFNQPFFTDQHCPMTISLSRQLDEFFFCILRRTEVSISKPLRVPTVFKTGLQAAAVNSPLYPKRDSNPHKYGPKPYAYANSATGV